MSSRAYFEVPLRTSGGGNNREHHYARARRVKREREAVAWVLLGKPRPALPVVAHLVRLAPSNGLDDDNLRQALKAVRDQVAVWLGVDDRDPRVTWTYGQQRAAWGVRIEAATVEQLVPA